MIIGEKTFKNKIIITFSFFVLTFSFVLVKAIYVQVVNNKKLLNYSKGQILREATIYPNRGHIYDRNGSPLAINVKTYSIFAIPRNMDARDYALRNLSQMVPDLKYSELKTKLYKRLRYTWLARKISLTDSQVEKIKKIKGIYIEAVPKRFYPNKELLSQTLGFVGVDNSGLSGVEFLFDKDLKGKPIQMRYYQDAKGRPIKLETEDQGGSAKDIFLSVDKELQSFAEKTIKDAVIEFQAAKGGIGVINPKNGEILAIANYPTFDPNDVDSSSQEARKLGFVSDPFEPGSTFKLLTVASALENKIARPDTSYYCEQGKLLVDDHVISEAETKKKYEWLTVSDIVRHSSNIGTTKIAFDVTFPKLDKTMKLFKIGEKSGIEIPGESRGIYQFKENVSPLTLSNISFGQGVATTGIQMLATYAVFENGGKYFRPTIIRGGNNGITPPQIISQETAKSIQKMLVKAVDEGTGFNAQIPHFVIAGKTSTAQKHDKDGGYKGYVPGFIGFPTNSDQKFVIYAYIDEPQVKYYGNDVAAPVFKKIAQYILYRNKEFNLGENKKPQDAKEQDKENLIDNKKLNPSNSKNKKDQRDEVKVVHSASRHVSKDVMPNFEGLDKLSSQSLLRQIDYPAIHSGVGVVIGQFPPAGSPLKKDISIKLNYSLPKYE